MRTFIVAVLAFGAFSSFAHSENGIYQCVAEKMAAANPEKYGYLLPDGLCIDFCEAEIDAKLNIVEMAGHLDAMAALAACNSQQK